MIHAPAVPAKNTRNVADLTDQKALTGRLPPGTAELNCIVVVDAVRHKRETGVASGIADYHQARSRAAA
jgi:hypothetical protein